MLEEKEISNNLGQMSIVPTPEKTTDRFTPDKEENKDEEIANRLLMLAMRPDKTHHKLIVTG